MSTASLVKPLDGTGTRIVRVLEPERLYLVNHGRVLSVLKVLSLPHAKDGGLISDNSSCRKKKADAGQVYTTLAQIKSDLYDEHPTLLRSTTEVGVSTVSLTLPTEAQIMRRLSGHPNIVEYRGCFAAGRYPNTCWHLFLGFEPDGDLQHVLSERRNRSQPGETAGKGIPERAALEILAQIASPLSFCHSNGVQHRDVKPSNIFLDFKKNLVKLGDFGISRVEEHHHSSKRRIGVHDVAEQSMSPTRFVPEKVNHLDGGMIRTSNEQKQNTFGAENANLEEQLPLDRTPSLREELEQDEGVSVTAKTVDLGNSTAVSSRPSAPLEATFTHLPPEVLSDAEDGWSSKADIYQLGVVLYECCSLHLPYDASSIGALTLKIATGVYEPLCADRYGERIHYIVRQMLKRTPGKRPAAAEILSWMQRPETKYCSSDTKNDDLVVHSSYEQQLLTEKEAAGIRQCIEQAENVAAFEKCTCKCL
ncbi:unnamed protein product, partial [Amoebophrya sp. A25]|eukprot:GSA25T00007684001.1